MKYTNYYKLALAPARFAYNRPIVPAVPVARRNRKQSPSTRDDRPAPSAVPQADQTWGFLCWVYSGIARGWTTYWFSLCRMVFAERKRLLRPVKVAPNDAEMSMLYVQERIQCCGATKIGQQQRLGNIGSNADKYNKDA